MFHLERCSVNAVILSNLHLSQNVFPLLWLSRTMLIWDIGQDARVRGVLEAISPKLMAWPKMKRTMQVLRARPSEYSRETMGKWWAEDQTFGE